MSALPQAIARPSVLAMPWGQAGLTLALTSAALLLLYRDSAWAMALIWWRSDTFAHGILVLPISLWLAWRGRHQLEGLQPQVAPAMLLPVALVGLLWLAGEVATVNALTQWAVVALLVLSVVALLGTRVAGALMFPLCFLFFAVPLGEFLLPQLIQWTADFTTAALRLSGIPVYREGNSFVIPSGRWSVVEACSGVRYLIASFMVGNLFAYLSYRSYWRRLVFAGFSLLVPLLANWVRAYMIVMLGHLSNNRIATGVDHVVYGWLFFGVVIGLMFWVGSRWSEAPAPAPHPQWRSPADLPRAGSARQMRTVALALVLLAALPHGALWRMDQAAIALPVQAAQALLSPPVLGARWPQLASATPTFKPAYQNASAEWQAAYGTSLQEVGLYVALYRQQGRGHTLVSSDNTLLRIQDPQWLLLSQGQQTLGEGPEAMALHTSDLRSKAPGARDGPTELLAWQLYWVNGHVTTSDAMAKAYGAWARLTGQSDDAALLVVFTPPGAQGEGAATLSSFWSDNFEALSAWLQRSSSETRHPKEGLQ